MVPSRLVLQSGEVFEGVSPPGQEDPCFGEVVFTTGMTGYVESLTDPSFTGQILTFTYPLIGNYGVSPQSTWESGRIQARGVVLAHVSPFYSHSESILSFTEWLATQNIPWIAGVDTRALTKRLRREGVVLGAISYGIAPLGNFADPNERDLVAEVSPQEPQIYGTGEKTVILVDCGMKNHILQCLLRFPLRIKRVPHNYDYSEEEFAGVVLSNGPGDPAKCVETVAILQKALQRQKPIFGICLGTQLLALAIGAKTYKLPFGHRGHNQPCIEEETKRCFLTSQNHGYAIDETTLPSQWHTSFRNLNDGSVEGIKHVSAPFWAVQFHPEAAPGPLDTLWLFEQFYAHL